MTERVTLSDAEAEQLYDYMRNTYLDRNKYGHLGHLLDRIYAHLQIGERLIRQVVSR